jgi:antirestriction protein ArdC
MKNRRKNYSLEFKLKALELLEERGCSMTSLLFHEIIHWSGHQNRLNRDLSGHKNPLSYSFEELIAEMGSMLICLQFGISEEFINSVRYLKGWSSKNTNREESIRKAFTESKRAKKYLENL